MINRFSSLIFRQITFFFFLKGYPVVVSTLNGNLNYIESIENSLYSYSLYNIFDCLLDCIDINTLY